jgi:hypothetical protein
MANIAAFDLTSFIVCFLYASSALLLGVRHNHDIGHGAPSTFDHTVTQLEGTLNVLQCIRR